jgi:hypothetical protein
MRIEVTARFGQALALLGFGRYGAACGARSMPSPGPDAVTRSARGAGRGRHRVAVGRYRHDAPYPKGADNMTQDFPKTSRAELVRMLQRVGYPANLIEEIAAQVGDPVDPELDREILERYGVTRGHLSELMGASP